MPTISRFLGMVITMYFEDHFPPHFHVRYSGSKALIRIEQPGLLEGDLPPRALGLVTEWARINRQALLDDWERARRSMPLAPVAPLD